MSEGKHEDDTDLSAQAESADTDTETGAEAKCTIHHVGAAVERELDGLWFSAKVLTPLSISLIRAPVVLTLTAVAFVHSRF
jgi:hypothetical protein